MSVEIIENLKKAILEYDSEAAANWARKAVQEKVDPNEALRAMTEAIREIGNGFGTGELFLPDLVGAADAMSAATPIEPGLCGDRNRLWRYPHYWENHGGHATHSRGIYRRGPRHQCHR